LSIQGSLFSQYAAPILNSGETMPDGIEMYSQIRNGLYAIAEINLSSMG